MKNMSDIIVEEWDRVWNSDEGKKVTEAMDSVNPIERCLMCGRKCGKAHILCVNCYAWESIK